MSPPTLPSPELPRQPQLLRFGLRQMFIMVTLLCALCALLAVTGGAWPLVIGGGAVLVAGHVLGNLIGTRLRDTSAEVLHWRAEDPRFRADRPLVHTDPVQIAELNLPPGTPLGDRGRVVGGWWIWFVAAGAMLGFIVGGSLIYLTIGQRISWAGWAVGTVSCSVLGTWSAFLASSFGSIARHAWRHASEEAR